MKEYTKEEVYSFLIEIIKKHGRLRYNELNKLLSESGYPEVSKLKEFLEIPNFNLALFWSRVVVEMCEREKSEAALISVI